MVSIFPACFLCMLVFSLHILSAEAKKAAFNVSIGCLGLGFKLQLIFIPSLLSSSLPSSLAPNKHLLWVALWKG